MCWIHSEIVDKWLGLFGFDRVLRLMRLLILFIQATRSDLQSPLAQGLAQRTGQVLDFLVYNLDMKITFLKIGLFLFN